MAKITPNWTGEIEYFGTDKAIAKSVGLSNSFTWFQYLPNVGPLVDPRFTLSELGESKLHEPAVNPAKFIEAANERVLKVLQEGLAHRRQGIDPDLDKLGY